MRNTRGGDFAKKDSDFPSFWFEGNLWFGWVNTQQQMDDLLLVYREALSARQSESFKAGMKFGFRRECDGKLTLGDWLREKE